MQGLATFLPKLIQNQFSLSASQAAVNVGAVSVVAGGGGTLLGGLIVKKLGLKVTGLLKMTSLTQLLAILTAIGLLVGCPPVPTIGLSDMPEELVGCDCECDMYDYQPVCSQGGQHQFFNPCYAGCQAKESGPDGHFLNCSCIPQLMGGTQAGQMVYTDRLHYAPHIPCLFFLDNADNIFGQHACLNRHSSVRRPLRSVPCPRYSVALDSVAGNYTRACSIRKAV